MQIQLFSCLSKLPRLKVYHANVLNVWLNIFDKILTHEIRVNIIVSILCIFKLHHKPMSESSLQSSVNMSFQKTELGACYYLMAFRAVVSAARG